MGDRGAGKAPALFDEPPRTAHDASATSSSAEGQGPAALYAHKRAQVLTALRGVRFGDVAPALVWATLLEEDVYLASESTSGRLLPGGVHGDAR